MPYIHKATERMGRFVEPREDEQVVALKTALLEVQNLKARIAELEKENNQLKNLRTE